MMSTFLKWRTGKCIFKPFFQDLNQSFKQLLSLNKNLILALNSYWNLSKFTYSPTLAFFFMKSTGLGVLKSTDFYAKLCGFLVWGGTSFALKPFFIALGANDVISKAHKWKCGSLSALWEILLLTFQYTICFRAFDFLRPCSFLL